MIAYCGLDCSKCEGLLATKSGKASDLNEVAKKWSAQFHADVKPEHVICDGCKADGRKSFHCQNMCNIRKCASEKKFDTCGSCDSWCDDLKFVINNADCAKKNIEAARAKRQK